MLARYLLPLPMTDPSQKFAPHGSSRFEVRDCLLLLYSEGPFNAEHIYSLAPAFREHAGPLAERGPWATINIVDVSIMSSPEGVEAMRRSAQWTRDALGRSAAAYVVAPGVEGRKMMEPLLLQACGDIFPVRFFAELAEAEQWAREQVAQARLRSA